MHTSDPDRRAEAALGPTPTPAGARLDRSAVCVRCSYDLCGLAFDGQCPECGESIARSLAGDLLRGCSPEYLRTLCIGLRLISIGLCLTILVTLATVINDILDLGVREIDLTIHALSFLVDCVLLLGYWKYTALEPARAAIEQPTDARRIIRMTVVISFVTVTSTAMLRIFRPQDIQLNGVRTPAEVGVAIAGILVFLIWLVQFFALISYTSRIAARVPDAELVKRIRLYRWIIPAIFVGGMILVGLGPLIASIMYWSLLVRVRAGVARVAYASRYERDGVAADLPGRLG